MSYSPMKLFSKSSVVVLITSALFLCSPVQSREGDQISIVGSSTVFPFATVVAERFGKNTDYKAPVIESTGSGGGMKLFCAGIGILSLKN